MLPSERTSIVVGLDGSESSIDALRWAGTQAQCTGHPIELVTTWEIPPYYGGYVVDTSSIDWAGSAKATQDAALKDADLPDGLVVTGSVVEGHPAQVLVDRSLAATLLVVGSRGHGGFSGLLLGSVSAHVAEHSSCPVVVIRHHEQAGT